MSDNSIARVHYFEGQFLRTQDFVDEQAYHVAMHRRHNIAHHTWGIVNGLELVVEDGNFFVQPGMAVDGYGRELILPQKTALSSSAFVDKQSNELDVWLTYGLKSSDEAKAGFAGCGSGKNGNKTSESFYRWQETVQLRVEKPNPDFLARREPEEVAIADRTFSPVRTAPDSPEISWPVFLGQIVSDSTNQKQPLAVKFDDRPYVGLVGEEIAAPSGRARVQIGSDPQAGGRRRFAVLTRDVTMTEKPRLEIDVDGEVTIPGNATVQGNLVVAGGAVEFQAGVARDPMAPPWDIYHLKTTETQIIDGVEQGVDVEELRIEMPAARPGGVEGNNRVVVGTWSKHLDATGQEKEEFHPCLTIRDNCTVEVAGNLVVNGNITAKTVVGGRLTDEARNALTSALSSGILATSGRLPAVSAQPSPTLAQLTPPLDAVVSRLENEEAFRNEFIQKMTASSRLNVSLKT